MVANGHINSINDPGNGASRRKKVVRFESRDRMGPHWSKYIRISSWALGVGDVKQGTGDGRLNFQGATTLI
jgi:hypothetical protein